MIKKITVPMICIAVLIWASTQTLWLHPQPRGGLLENSYTAYPDLWFKKEGNKKLVIALHGMYAHPWIFEELGNRISAKGWDLYAPALPNAALSPEDLKTQDVYQWKEILAAARAKAEASVGAYDTVVLLGHSQGGALVLALAPDFPAADAAAVVSAPLYLEYGGGPLRALGVWCSGALYFALPGHGIALGPPRPKELEELEDIRGGGNYMYALTIHSLNLGLKEDVRPRLPEIRQPLFAAYEKRDYTVGFSNLAYLTNKIGSQAQDILVTDSRQDTRSLSTRHLLFSYRYVKEELHSRLEAFLDKLP